MARQGANITAAVTAVIIPESGWDVVLKKIIFDGPLLIVLLGLEGTGHHGACACLAEPSCEFGQPAGSQLCTTLDGHMQLLVRRLVFSVPGTLQRTRSALHRRLRFYTNLTDAHRLLFQCTSSVESIYPSSMMSYPDAELAMLHAVPEEGKATANMDAVALAAAAETAGVDLRFVVLRRDPADAIASVVRRTTLTFEAAARILRTADAVLAWQLSQLDSAFVHAWHYGAPDIDSLAAFLRLNATTLGDCVARNFRVSMHALGHRERAFAEHLWR